MLKIFLGRNIIVEVFIISTYSTVLQYYQKYYVQKSSIPLKRKKYQKYQV